ncbi:Na+/H+ antiporter NhaC family protein [Aliiglaciecola sp. 2_MG-2023]|uniref:Na+/H+ antiporter NhaC family protein n=1 Tax=unclassified Aliiglaciecola TaxID=2593648 RepID=UPI0026E16AFF|nr:MULTISPECIES: Na+/H+ antiporter NhaC family protein [unclassified Aliiglaciecola]MDO6711635.1 Na+/H+ antiporter NhaC family protein [Aliiglaciecola sp. 2_MG-2023]MDO6752706.1 Na+/H+ antiporter NhaC family protein [Aliiglaciecola sp. 1_MG-2023]
MKLNNLFIAISVIILSVGSVLYAPPFDAQHPSFIAVIPPVLAILFSFIFRQVIVSMIMGIWFGAWVINGADINAVITSLFDVPAKYAVSVLVDSEHIMLILLSVFIGGLMAVIYRNGGMLGLVNIISKRANTRKKAQLSAAFIGILIFFDDYSNTLLTGNTMRPLMDRLRVSREKLAYIVDSTAAPITSIAVISLWVGFQVGLIETATKSITELESPFMLFIHSIAYSFYPILALLFVFIVASTGRDFGPMLEAEKSALKTLNEENKIDSPQNSIKISSAYNATIPIFVLVSSMLTGLYITGDGNTLFSIISSADPFKSLLIAGFVGSIVAIVMSVSRKLMSLNHAIETWGEGVSSITSAVIILVLSWSLAQLTQEMNTAQYIITQLGDSVYAPVFPAIVFVLSAIIALGTGSSWGTMAILVPLVIPLSWKIINQDIDIPAAANMHIFYSSISAVLAGSVWGDHCSPISDTTVLSSMASKCDHIQHVRTQMPYALLVGFVAVMLGTLPAGFGFPWWLGLLVGAACLIVTMRIIGKRS